MVRELLDKARELSMFTAYNTNVDAIVYLNGKTVQRLIDEFGAEAVKRRMEEYPREINEPPLDFVARLVHALKTGKPMAVPPLVNEELQAWFDSHFKYDVERMGGQAGIIANLLANLDFREVLVYTPHLPRGKLRCSLRSRTSSTLLSRTGSWFSSTPPGRPTARTTRLR